MIASLPSGAITRVTYSPTPGVDLTRAEALNHPAWVVARWDARYGEDATTASDVHSWAATVIETGRAAYGLDDRPSSHRARRVAECHEHGMAAIAYGAARLIGLAKACDWVITGRQIRTTKRM